MPKKLFNYVDPGNLDRITASPLAEGGYRRKPLLTLVRCPEFVPKSTPDPGPHGKQRPRPIHVRVFVGRDHAVQITARHGCGVDVGWADDPARLGFVHKPPPLHDLNLSCASGLLREYLVDLAKPVRHPDQLVRMVHECDRRRCWLAGG